MIYFLWFSLSKGAASKLSIAAVGKMVIVHRLQNVVSAVSGKSMPYLVGFLYIASPDAMPYM
jgi:hypothetical protein